MRPDHLLGPAMRMSVNSGRPIMGLLASAGLGFLSSTIGCPVAGLTGSRSQTMTPQIASPHLLTRTRASPACVSQTPSGLAPACAFAADESAINSGNINQDRTIARISLSDGLHSKKAGVAKTSCDHLPQRASFTDAAVESPNATMAAPTSANSVQAGALEDASHQPPMPTMASRSVEASTGPPTFAAPCEEK